MKQTYKSPWAALLWSLALPGFGQIYNSQYVLGLVFIILELLINGLSDLNLAIMNSFHGHFITVHEIIDYSWGMYYPSVWAFSMWQAYNKAREINAQLEGKELKTVYFTGFFFGAICGINFGLFWHHHLFNNPIFNGLTIGFITAFSGYFVEKYITNMKEKKQ